MAGLRRGTMVLNKHRMEMRMILIYRMHRILNSLRLKRGGGLEAVSSS